VFYIQLVSGDHCDDQLPLVARMEALVDILRLSIDARLRRERIRAVISTEEHSKGCFHQISHSRYVLVTKMLPSGQSLAFACLHYRKATAPIVWGFTLGKCDSFDLPVLVFRQSKADGSGLIPPA
jgi:hypothetical protein